MRIKAYYEVCYRVPLPCNFLNLFIILIALTIDIRTLIVKLEELARAPSELAHQCLQSARNSMLWCHGLHHRTQSRRKIYKLLYFVILPFNIVSGLSSLGNFVMTLVKLNIVSVDHTIFLLPTHNRRPNTNTVSQWRTTLGNCFTHQPSLDKVTFHNWWEFGRLPCGNWDEWHNAL